MAAPLPRFPDWRARLSSYLIECASRDMAWGEHDCALFIAGGVLAQTGHDFAAPFRGKYKTERGAAKALIRYGAGTLADTVAAALPEIDPAQARQGDICLFDQPDGLTCGIVLRANIAAVTATGLTHVSKDRIVRAFRVGE